MVGYDEDFYGWVQEQAALLREGRFRDADMEHIIEELEAMGKSERRQLVNRLRVLFTHLLIWRHQPERRGRSWQHTVRNQRRDCIDLIDENPSLKPHLPEIVRKAYERARDDAAAQTGLVLETFPEECPFPLESALDHDYWPEGSGS